jgi:P27 family predicted phage terminase small subunit
MPAWRGIDKEKEKLHSGRIARRSRTERGFDSRKDKRKPISLTGNEIKAPSWMSAEETAIFEDMRTNILMFDIATLSDKYSFQILCLQYAQYFTLSRVIAEEGYMIEVMDKSGNACRKPHPLLVERHRIYNSCKDLMKEFGMTPKTHRLVVKADPNKPDSKEEDEWDEILN